MPFPFLLGMLEEAWTIPSTAPSSGSAVPVPSWFMDKNGAWWEDEWGNTDLWPTVTVVSDGDLPGDRVLLLGCGDGYVRKWDETSADDDDQAIDSRVMVGPLAPGSETRAYRFSKPQVVLSAEQDGCNLEMYASNTAELTGEPVARVELLPGVSGRKPMSAKGAAVRLRLRNPRLGERWSLEKMDISVAPAGRVRP